AVVPMMLILEVAAAGEFDIMLLGRIALSIGLLAILIFWLSRRRRVNLPEPGVVKFHPDLMPVLGLAVCFGAATASGLLGLSPAYGAFLAGLTIGNSNLRTGMLETVMPIQGVLMMVFFLSVGLLIDINLIWQNIGIILTMLLAVTVLKTVLNVGILRALRLPWTEAMVTGLVLAQVGEFSFLLAGAGVRMEIIDIGDFRLVITVTALSLAISSLWLAAARRLQNAALSQSAPGRQVFSLLYGREAGWVASGYRRLRGRAPPTRLEPQAPARGTIAEASPDPAPDPNVNPHPGADHGSMDAR
ncbi:MAG: cation:proton antiporter domain-containing protein, partial [Alphaproteobacteria bacterium]